MDVFLRTIAISLEVLMLVTIAGCVLGGVALILFDMGIGRKYSKAITLALIGIGGVVTVFFISHLILFYPKL